VAADPCYLYFHRKPAEKGAHSSGLMELKLSWLETIVIPDFNHSRRNYGLKVHLPGQKAALKKITGAKRDSH